ncbi:MAG: VgrG-related protein [Anaerolineae bacterium]
MAESNVINNQIDIRVNGSPIEPSLLNSVIEVVVDQHTHLPHMFTIRLYDPGMALLDNGPFDLTKEISIAAPNESDQNFNLIKGEITALEPEFNEGMVSILMVRGYDKSHRLFRETKSKAYLNIKDSDLANQFAGNAGLGKQIETTTTVYDHVYQDNQSDLAFLMQRAWRIGYECFVDEGKLYFRKPPGSGPKAQLTWGIDLITFAPVMTLAEQVDEVLVKGWDATKLTAIVGQAKKGTLYPKNGEAKDGAGWAGTFGNGKQIIVDVPVVSQAEADQLAQARLNELSGAFVEAEGLAHRRPDIRAGQFVELAGVGKRLSGAYMVTKATHIFTHAGLKTQFMARGSRTGLLAEQMNRQEPLKRWTGVVTAVVTNTDDPNNWGRVKLKFPWMTDDAESDWARLAGAGAGPEAGFFLVPDVDDEVLVAFEHGDFNRPIVLGGLWNGKHKIPPPDAAAAAGEKPLVRTWHSRTGHYMSMHDDADNKVEIVTAGGHSCLLDDANKKVEIVSAGGHKATMDDQEKKLEIITSGGHKISMDDNGRKITIQSVGDIEIKAGMNMKLEASGMMDIKASGQVNIKGTMVNIN